MFSVCFRVFKGVYKWITNFKFCDIYRFVYCFSLVFSKSFERK